MSVSIRLNQVFLDATANREIVQVEGRTVGECLKDLVRQYPELESRIFDPEQNLSALVIARGSMLLPNQLDLPVADEEELQVLPLIYGG